MDAGAQIGLGHLQRSLALAKALKALDVESTFLGNDDTPSREYVARHGFLMGSLTSIESWTLEDSEATIERAARSECGAVVVDYHEAGSWYLARLRDAGLFVIARDDLASYTFPCQMVVNGNADATRLPYTSSIGDTLFLLGPRYMVMRDEFLGPPARLAPSNVGNLLVMLGGADGQCLMPRILGLLDRIPGDFAVTCVVGPFFQDVGEVRNVVATATRPMQIVQSPASVKDLMLEADLAISAAGQTLYELACAGCPTVAIETASNQHGQMRALADSGVIVEAGNAASDDVLGTLEETLLSLMSDLDQRQRMATAGQGLVDGKGAERVTQAIVSAWARETEKGLILT